MQATEPAGGGAPEELFPGTLLSKVEATAVQVCLYRCVGNAHLRFDGTVPYDTYFDQLLVDACMSSAAQRAFLDDGPRSSFVPTMAVRTQEIDQQLSHAIQSGVMQLVVLGAGLDMRAWRLKALAAHVTLFEVDTGSVEALKARVLAQHVPLCRRVCVTANLGDAAAFAQQLAAAGHNARAATAWVAEGLIGYLTRPQGDALLCQAAALSAPGSRLIMTAPPTPQWRDALAAQGVALHHTTFESASDTLQRACAAGWRAALLTQQELRRRYGLNDMEALNLILGDI